MKLTKKKFKKLKKKIERINKNVKMLHRMGISVKDPNQQAFMFKDKKGNIYYPLIRKMVKDGEKILELKTQNILVGADL